MTEGKTFLVCKMEIPRKSPLWMVERGQPNKCSEGTVADLIAFFCFFPALGLHCCTRVFSSCREQGLLLVAERRLLIAVACLVAKHRL